MIKKIAALLAVMTLTVALPVGIARAADPQISIPITTVVKNVGVGSRTQLTKVSIDQEHIGLACSVKAVAVNQGSVHPGNDLEVSSDNSSVLLKNVERAANVTTIADGKITLGENVIVTLIMGQDNVFSGGLNVTFDCEEPPKDIEVCRDGKVITIKEDERLETDTNPPCPEIEIQVCRDGKVITIKEDEKLDSDTSAPCPPPKGYVIVCRDGQVITVSENDIRDSDTTAPCPTPVVLGTSQTPTIIPNTGAGGALAIVAGSGVAGTIGHALVTRRRL